MCTRAHKKIFFVHITFFMCTIFKLILKIFCAQFCALYINQNICAQKCALYINVIIISLFINVLNIFTYYLMTRSLKAQ